MHRKWAWTLVFEVEGKAGEVAVASLRPSVHFKGNMIEGDDEIAVITSVCIDGCEASLPMTELCSPTSLFTVTVRFVEDGRWHGEIGGSR